MTKKFKNYFLFTLVSLMTIFASFAHAQTQAQEIPWAWYTARVGGLVAFLLLYISIFLGLAIRTKGLNKIIAPKYSFETHCWISLQATLFAFLHGFILLFDKTLNFSLADLFVPFVSSYQSGPISMGIIGFYLMIVLVVSSYLKKHISHGVWRALHSLNIGLYFILIGHALTLGTDLKAGIMRSVFIWANVLLMILFVYNLFVRIFLNKLKANKLTPNS